MTLNQRPLLVYVAGKYRSRWGLAGRCLNIFRAWLVGRQVARVSAMPIVPHCGTALYDGLQSDQFFLDGTLELLRRCDVIVLMPGWLESSGARAELAEAERLGMPAFTSVASLKHWVAKPGALLEMAA